MVGDVNVDIGLPRRDRHLRRKGGIRQGPDCSAGSSLREPNTLDMLVPLTWLVRAITSPH
jgi:hypothetical protein